MAGREAGRVERAQVAGGLEGGRAVPGGHRRQWEARVGLRGGGDAAEGRVGVGGEQRAVAGVEEGELAGRVTGRGDDLERADALAGGDRAGRSGLRPIGVDLGVLRLAGLGLEVAGHPLRVARRHQHLRVRELGDERVEPADVVLVGVGEDDAHDRALRLGEDRLRGAAAEGGVDQRHAVVLVHEVGVDEAAEAGDADAAHERSSSATHSMCGVCGNMSTGRTCFSVQPASTSCAAFGRERRRVAGDVDDPLGPGLDDAAHDLLREAGARRVDDRDVGLAGALDQVAHREPDVAGEEGGVGDLVERARSRSRRRPPARRSPRRRPRAPAWRARGRSCRCRSRGRRRARTRAARPRRPRARRAPRPSPCWSGRTPRARSGSAGRRAARPAAGRRGAGRSRRPGCSRRARRSGSRRGGRRRPRRSARRRRACRAT